MLLAWGALTWATVSACGGDDFENERQPPVQLATTAVITEQDVDVSPNRFGAGPVLLTISNQTSQPHSITVRGQTEEGEQVLEETGPINPSDTAQIEQDLDPGTYRVLANSGGTASGQIQPGKIVVGPERESGSGELELP